MSTHVSAPSIADQLELVFSAWGMSPEHARTTADLMAETDLRGVDSHGIAMLPTYERDVRQGKVNVRPVFRTVRDGPATALIDADASLGHPPSVEAMRLAVDKCLVTGVAVVTVRNSHHFGAAACYTQLALDRGVIGVAMTSTTGINMVPTFGAEAVLGTNPIAFGAPGGRNPSFHLDMATTTVAGGKVKVHKLNHRPLPPGWVVDGRGQVVTDVDEAVAALWDRNEGGITPLGGTREMSSHKGYGLAAMVQILSGTLSGSAFSPIRNRTQGPGDPNDVGHFFLAIDPRAFRDEGAFEQDLDELVDVLHATRPASADQPVLVAGDRAAAARRDRLAAGIPIPDDLLAQVRAVVDRAGVPFILQ